MISRSDLLAEAEAIRLNLERWLQDNPNHTMRAEVVIEQDARIDALVAEVESMEQM